MDKARGFTKGSGCYRCESCLRLTRVVADPAAANHRLCEPCYELAGWINLHADCGHNGSVLDCTECGAACMALVMQGAQV